jgi:tetratricopeptide (TPR) repeat protein
MKWSGTLLAAALLMGLVVGGCSELRESTLERGIELFLDNRLQEALPLLEASAQSWKDNPEAHAWLAECLRRLNKYDEAAKAAYTALMLDETHAFAHTVMADLFNPQYSAWRRADFDTTWYHLREAVRHDASDGNAWSALWIQAMRKGDRQLERTAAIRMIDSGFLSKPLLAYNRWQLQHLPENAILLTNGDMDTYPAAALREKERLREDVAVINLSLLNVPWYQRLMADRYDLPLSSEADRPFRDDDGVLVLPSRQVVGSWMQMEQRGELGRPLCAAVTVADFDFTPDARERMILCGPYYEIFASPVEHEVDLDRLKRCLDSIDPLDFEGDFATPIDRSPVRRGATNRLATNVTSAMLRYAGALAKGGRWEEAATALDYAEDFDSRILAGGEFAEHIGALRHQIDTSNPQ